MKGERRSKRKARDAKGVRACARDAQTLTPRAGGRVGALRVRGTTPGGEGPRQERETRKKNGRARETGVGRPTSGVAALWRQIVRTKAESQRIVATRPLCRVQYPVPYSSRLQVIHRAGSGNCDRSRLMQYVCAWLPPHGRPLSFRHGF